MSAAASHGSANPAAVNPAQAGSFSSFADRRVNEPASQPRIDFADSSFQDEDLLSPQVAEVSQSKPDTVRDLDAIMRQGLVSQTVAPDAPIAINAHGDDSLDCGGSTPLSQATLPRPAKALSSQRSPNAMPPLNSADKFAREVSVESLSTNIRPLGQLDESFIIATDDEGLLLIDQHVAHERILFDRYRALESARTSQSQQLLIPETFDLTPAQAAVFDTVATELESYGFELMRLSGRTVAIKAAPADLPAGEARNMLAEILDTVDAEKKGSARETLRDDIAASLACHAAIKVNMPLTPEKMRWLIDRLLRTSSPTTCPHGRPVILRLATRDILKGFHRI
jgi:DNA mismatch repair ATPase MutL